MPNSNLTPSSSPSTSSPSTTSPSTTSSNLDVSSTHSSDNGHDLSDRVERSVDKTARAATAKAQQVRDQVQSASSSMQDKASHLQQDLKDGVNRTAHQVEHGAQAMVATAKDALAHAGAESSALIHDARDAIADGYESARDYALDVVHEGSELAGRTGRKAASYVRRASLATGRFASVHALPLTMLGASIGWLAWSMRNDARMRLPREVLVARSSARSARLRAPAEASHPDVRNINTLAVPPSAATTSGAKLIGVRAGDTGYDRRLV